MDAIFYYKPAPYNKRDYTDAELEQMDRDEEADREMELTESHTDMPDIPE